MGNSLDRYRKQFGWMQNNLDGCKTIWMDEIQFGWMKKILDEKFIQLDG